MYTVLYYTVLYYNTTILYYTILYCTVLYYIYIVLYYTPLYILHVHCIVNLMCLIKGNENISCRKHDHIEMVCIE